MLHELPLFVFFFITDSDRYIFLTFASITFVYLAAILNNRRLQLGIRWHTLLLQQMNKHVDDNHSSRPSDASTATKHSSIFTQEIQ